MALQVNSVFKSKIGSKSRREHKKLHTVTILGCLYCEEKTLLPPRTKQQELHSAAL